MGELIKKGIHSSHESNNYFQNVHEIVFEIRQGCKQSVCILDASLKEGLNINEKEGLNINEKDDEGMTALMNAIITGYNDIMRILYVAETLLDISQVKDNLYGAAALI